MTKGMLMGLAKDHLLPDSAELDAAIPQRIADRIALLQSGDEDAVNVSDFCWAYMSTASLFGGLYPLTKRGAKFLYMHKKSLGQEDYEKPLLLAEDFAGDDSPEVVLLKGKIRQVADALIEKRSDITDVLYDLVEGKPFNVGDIGPRFVRYPMPDLDQYENGQVHAMLVDSETGFLELEDMRGERIGEAISPSDFHD